MTRNRLAIGFALLGIGLLSWGSYLGLVVAPPDRYMGDVQRIMYVHVPTAWMALVVFTLAFAYALLFLLRRTWRWDALHEASLEIGVLYTAMLCVQGALWGKPTWGVYWAWDPRLTTVAVMLLSFTGILSLRHFLDDPLRRASWSAAATILAATNVPVVYYSVRWWNSLHQLQSSPQTVNSAMVAPLRINAFGLLALTVALLILRAKLAESRRRKALAPPLAEAHT
jgi:heme exporter protein C